MHLFYGTVDPRCIPFRLPADKIDVFPRFKLKMFSIREVEPVQDRYVHLKHESVDRGLRISSGLYIEFHS